MGTKDRLDRALGFASSAVSRLRGGSRNRRPGISGIPNDLSSDVSNEGSQEADGFPGFVPPPSFRDRVRDSLASMGRTAKEHPRFLPTLLGCGIAICALILGGILIFRPPAPMEPLPSPGRDSSELLRAIPVPVIDPLAVEVPLDRPRKDRYTEREIAEKWLDLGQLSVEELREENRTEIRKLLSALERP